MGDRDGELARGESGAAQSSGSASSATWKPAAERDRVRARRDPAGGAAATRSARPSTSSARERGDESRHEAEAEESRPGCRTAGSPPAIAAGAPRGSAGTGRWYPTPRRGGRAGADRDCQQPPAGATGRQGPSPPASRGDREHAEEQGDQHGPVQEEIAQARSRRGSTCRGEKSELWGEIVAIRAQVVDGPRLRGASGERVPSSREL